MMVSFIKNWFKSWALWVWVLFIRLLASDAELVPALQDVEGKEEIKKKKKIIKRKKVVEVKENEEESEKDQEKVEIIYANPEILVEDSSVAEEEKDQINNEEEIIVEDEAESDSKIITITREIEDSGNTLRVEEAVADESGEVSDNRDDIEDDDDDVQWIDVGRGTGLARYSGFQNLLDAEESNDKPLIVERRAPILASRREGGPLTLPRGMLIKSLSQEKDRLEEIPEEERQPSPRPGEQSLDNSDKIWAQLVARYAEESEKSVKMENRIVLMDQGAKISKQKIQEFTDENMTSKEFSEEVGKRLQQYLERVDENSDNENNEDDDGTREIEDDGVTNIELMENGGHKIFIMIEDDESNGEKDEILRTDEFNASNSDMEIAHYTEDNEHVNEEDDTLIIIPISAKESEDGKEQAFAKVYDEQDDKIYVPIENIDLLSGTSEILEPGDDITIPKSLDTEEVCEIKESVDDSLDQAVYDEKELSIYLKGEEKNIESLTIDKNDVSSEISSEIKVSEEPAIEIKESASKEDAPVFTVTLRRKSKPVIAADSSTTDDVSVLPDFGTGVSLEGKPVNETTPALPEPVSETFPVVPDRESEDVPAVTIMLPKKKKIAVLEEEKKPDVKNAAILSDSETLLTEEKKSDKTQVEKESQIEEEESYFYLHKVTEEREKYLKEHRKSLPTAIDDTFRKSEENLIKQKLGSERRSSRDLWKMECEKLLEEPSQVDIETLEEEKGEDIFITRYEEFPEDYIFQEESPHDVSEQDKNYSTDFEELSSIDVNKTQITQNIQDQSEDADTKESAIVIGMDNDFEIVSSSHKEEQKAFSAHPYSEGVESDNTETVSSIKRKTDQNISKEEDIKYSEDHVDDENIADKSVKKLKGEDITETGYTVKDDIEDFELQDESLPIPAQLVNVCDILTHSEQNLVARILLAQKSKDDFEDLQDEGNDDYFANESENQEVKANFRVSDSLSDLTGKEVGHEEENKELILATKDDDTENKYLDEDKLDNVKVYTEPIKTDDPLLSAEPELVVDVTLADVDEKSVKDSLTEKEIILELIRKERDPDRIATVDDSEVPEYLEDVKDLLVPRARRKKGRRRVDALSEILKVDESEPLPSKSATFTEDLNLDQNLRSGEDRTSRLLRELTPEEKNIVPGKQEEFLLTEEEQRELEEIKKEQEAYRAAQRKELEKFLAMPAALTEQEQRELEEFLAEEESDKAAVAGSEARLEALLADVRRRLLESGMDIDDENLDSYMSLPVDLTEEEERLLSNEEEGEEEEEKVRNDFETEEDYREYIKQRYLEDLEEDRIRVEEEELEFGEYYDDEYDYEDEEYGGEYLESDYVVMNDNEEAKVTLKDEAVGPDEPVQFEEKKGKKFFSIPGLRSRGSSKGSSRGSRASLDKPSSKDSSREGSVSGDTKEQNKQSKKFFRFGSLSIKRKKKSDEYPQCDPESEVKSEVEDAKPFCDSSNERNVAGNEVTSKGRSNVIAALFRKAEFGNDDSEVTDVIRKKRMLLLLKSIRKASKNNINLDSKLIENSKLRDSDVLQVRNCQINNNNNNNQGAIYNQVQLKNTCQSVNINNNDPTIALATYEKNQYNMKTHSQNTRTEKNVSAKDMKIPDRDDLKNSTICLEEDFVLIPGNEQLNAMTVIKNNVGGLWNNLTCQQSSDLSTSNKLKAVESLTTDSQVLSEVSILKDTAMSGEGVGHATSSVNGGISEEELWPEDSHAPEEGDEFDMMEKDVILEMEKETKKKRDGDKKGKKKRKKKGESEKENKKTAYQNKEELYEKHVGPRVRSFDTAKMKNKFSKPKEPTQVSSDCRICGKQVFQMEKIIAEKASWHKNCFRCKECNKNLTLETYQSHEGTLYCKPHFKELFRPKAVIQDEAEERKDRLLRRPRMIVLESNPEILPDDVVRATSKPDYGLEELQQILNVKERFNLFENLGKEEEKPRPEPVSVRRSQSLMSKAARFLDGQEDGECYDDDDDEEEEEEEEEEYEEDEADEDAVDGENEDGPVVTKRIKKKKERPMSFSGMGDLKSAWEQKQRREEMSQSRKEEITRFRQMLCAGKNITLKEKFESGNFDDHENDDVSRHKEEIKIEGKRAASNLKKRFEQGEPFIMEDDDEEGEDEEGKPKRRERIPSEKHEVEEIFKEAETAKKARNVFKQIDSEVAKEGTTILRSQSFASSNRENRHSMDASVLMHPPAPTGEVVKSSDKKTEDYSVDTTDLASRFKFFVNYEKDKEEEREKARKVFRITPPREGVDQVEDVDVSKAKMPKTCMAVNCVVCKLRRLQGTGEHEVLGRDPNLIKCTDNYQDEVDCRNTRNILQMFKKLEMGDDEEEEDEGPKPLKRFTPPPGGEECEEESDEYTDEEYSDEEEENDEEEEAGEGDNAAKVRDELLQMLSARKAASLRAKFERWEAEVERRNDINKEKEELEECMPSLDTAKNLKAMFEHKAIEVAKPVASKPITQKVNRFV